MVNLSTAQTTGIITLAMILLGAVTIDYAEQTYYCQPEDSVRECYRLSSTGVTCYMPTTSDRCTNGKWEKIDSFLAQHAAVQPQANGGQAVATKEEVWYIKDPNNPDVCYRYGSLREKEKCPS